MELSIEHGNGIHIALKALMARKSLRDQMNFTIYQLAKAINMPHSILLRLLHPDPSKRVNNPRIDTLMRIVEFFKADGFNVTIDDLLNGVSANKIMDVQSQKIIETLVPQAISVYSFINNDRQKIGTIDVKLSESSPSLFGLLSDEDLNPLFKKGSVFIINPDIIPRHNLLVAVSIDNKPKIMIRKLHIKNKKKCLTTYLQQYEPIELTDKINYKIIGVVIQVYAKTT
ncbi:MAG: S24 family peptidase [Gammaproteobacteria bacterium]